MTLSPLRGFMVGGYFYQGLHPRLYSVTPSALLTTNKIYLLTQRNM